MPTVRVNDVGLYDETHGSGPALVRIAGLNSDHTLFRSFIPRLAERYQVIVFDNRGIGQSTGAESAFTIEMLAEDTVGLLRVLGITRAHVLVAGRGGRDAPSTKPGPDLIIPPAAHPRVPRMAQPAYARWSSPALSGSFSETPASANVAISSSIATASSTRCMAMSMPCTPRRRWSRRPSPGWPRSAWAAGQDGLEHGDVEPLQRLDRPAGHRRAIWVDAAHGKAHRADQHVHARAVRPGHVLQRGGQAH
jgi:pimeloyl-ACP methyl ester carboxylesterase